VVDGSSLNLTACLVIDFVGGHPGDEMTAGDPRKVILLVDDDEDARELLAIVLEDEHYQVLRAENGAEALRLLGERPATACNIILLDLMMPIMNGWDFRRKQLENPQLAGIPVLLMSAGAHLAAACGDLHPAGYVTKPVEVEDLIAKIERFSC
jgi:CheY-like chemotaxis protein